MTLHREWLAELAADPRVTVADLLDVVALRQDGTPVPVDTLAKLEGLGYNITELN